MSDWIFVMNEGVVVQSGTPKDIYDEPINHYVADFIGDSNIIDATMIDDYVVEFVGHQFECNDGGIPSGERVEVVIRPEDIAITTPEEGQLVADVDTQLFRGVFNEVIAYDKQGNEWMIHTTQFIEEGSEIGLSFGPTDIHVMRYNESEEDFDARIEQYTDDEEDEEHFDFLQSNGSVTSQL